MATSHSALARLASPPGAPDALPPAVAAGAGCGRAARVARTAAGHCAAGRRRVVAHVANDRSRAEEVLEMQRRLLEQIEERKRLHALLMEGLNSDGAQEAKASLGEAAPGAPYTPRARKASSGSARAAPRSGGPTAAKGAGSPGPAPAGPKPTQSSPAAVAAAAAARRAAVAASGVTASPAAAAVAAPEVSFFVDAAADVAAESCVLPTAEAVLENVATPDVSTPFPHGSPSASPPPEEQAPEAKPLCKERLNVVMVAMECAPWSKTGGLGDVAGALPKALARRGHRTMCIAPRYANYAEGWETGIRIQLRVCGAQVEVGFFHGFIDGVDYVFVDHPAFHAFKDRLYGGSREELTFRCALLCQAALEAPWTVPCGGVPYGDESLVFLANDWHTALLPVFLQSFYRDHGKLTFARCCLVVHNMAHQGRGPMVEFDRLGLPAHWKDAFLLDDPFGGVCMNIFKAGILAAHKLIAVSEGYAWECATDLGGWGLAPTLRSQGNKLSGIVNGIDTQEWNPAVDPHLQSDGYVNYTPDEAGLAGKAACKAALQQQLGLPVRADVPLIGFIGRLDYQKGVDLICQSADHLVGQGAQLVLLGTGAADLENSLRSLESRHRNAARGWVGFSVAMSHRITAGCDLLLMPSRFEPCGLNQLYAMRYGTVPVVHSVGGLRDTVKPFNPFENTGTGWTFSPADAGRMNDALGNAMHTFRSYPDSFRGIQLRAMAQDLSWEVAASKYEDVMLGAKYTW